MWNSKRIGNIGEAKTLSKFVELQIPVCISFGDCERYDMVAEFNGKLNKIQCKTCLNMKDEDSFEIYIINRSTKEGKDISRSYQKRILIIFQSIMLKRIFYCCILITNIKVQLLHFALILRKITK